MILGTISQLPNYFYVLCCYYFLYYYGIMQFFKLNFMLLRFLLSVYCELLIKKMCRKIKSLPNFDKISISNLLKPTFLTRTF